MTKLSNAAARRIALAAQGFGVARVDARPSSARALAEVRRLSQLQIDSVQVLARAHLTPLFSRLGDYDVGLIDKWSSGRSQRRLYEGWGHAASLIDVNLYPALRWRAQGRKAHPWKELDEVFERTPDILDKVRARVADAGKLTTRSLNIGRRKMRNGWWEWGDDKLAIEWLFRTGDLEVAGRNSQFEREYALPEKVIPAALLGEVLGQDEAQVVLVRRAAAALGVASPKAIGDYFRLSVADTRRALAVVQAAGEVETVEVDGCKGPHYLWHEARRPRTLHTQALISPFDSLVFERGRLLELFGIDYTIGLYTPAAQRDYGYYVYLFLMDDGFAARVDLKADRAAATLLVQASWLEPAYAERRDEVARRLASELHLCATWLGLDKVTVVPRGDLANTLVLVI
ncbi:MAG: winged helix DNA-binding domain-containing protein [Propionibacteriaceae bacterium]|jgi:uncharacterized protein YcaQ|nr:winged helix DNA-binding domain-containing protein [Propionibacteriaceae bacterium]